MSFNKNLQNLRKRENMSQETLAGILDVSRQAVSKWESGNAYPETEKIIAMCKIFDCSMDELVMGDIPDFDEKNQEDNKLKQEYDLFYNKFSKAIALGVGLILLGVTFLVGITLSDVKSDAYLGVTVLLVCILIAVPIFIVFGLKDSDMKKKTENIEITYEKDEIENYKRKYPFIIAGSVALILFGVLVMIMLEGFDTFSNFPIAPVVFFLLCITIAVPVIIHSSFQNLKYENKNNIVKDTQKQKTAEKIHGVIMLSATFIFLFLGFLFNLWHIAWVVFPLGGILCGIVSTIIGENEK